MNLEKGNQHAVENNLEKKVLSHEVPTAIRTPEENVHQRQEISQKIQHEEDALRDVRERLEIPMPERIASSELEALKTRLDKVGMANKEVLNEEWKTALIESSENFIQLYTALQNIKEIKGSQQTFNGNELIGIVERVKGGELSIEHITRTNGIRDTVARLLNEPVSMNPKTPDPLEAKAALDIPVENPIETHGNESRYLSPEPPREASAEATIVEETLKEKSPLAEHKISEEPPTPLTAEETKYVTDMWDELQPLLDEEVRYGNLDLHDEDTKKFVAENRGRYSNLLSRWRKIAAFHKRAQELADEENEEDVAMEDTSQQPYKWRKKPQLKARRIM